MTTAVCARHLHSTPNWGSNPVPTREIGTRLAVGALEPEVLLQFLVEAVTFSLVGGVVGIILATAASMLLAKLMQVPFLFNLQINTVAIVFSAAVGVMFGYLPARVPRDLTPSRH